MNRGFWHGNAVHIYARLAGIGSKAAAHIVGHVARAKAQFEEASRGFKSQLAAELDAAHQAGKTDTSHEMVGDQ